MRTVCALAIGLAVGGCNMVISEQPWFAEPGSIQQKAGLWVTVENPATCQVDPATPVDKLLDCASPIMMTDTYYSGPPSKSSLPPEQRMDPANWEKLPHLLVDGAVQLDQLEFDARKEAGGQLPLKSLGGKLTYLYIAVRPTAFDTQGRIIATARWPVLCGPLQQSEKNDDGLPRSVTAKPFAGLTVVEDMACTAADVDALRAAAAKSEGIAKAAGLAIAYSRWVRDKP